MRGEFRSPEDIDLWRRLHWIIYEAEEVMGLRAGGRADFEREEMPLLDRLEEVLRAALASRGKLDPFRYRAVWTIKNLMVKYGATKL
jgi:hypothetical protein